MNDVQTVILVLGAVLLFAIMAFIIVGGIAFYRANQGQAKSFGLLFERGNFLHLATAVFIILGAIFLALLDKLNSEGVAAILSGVAGYVLGKMDRQFEESSNINGGKGGS